LPKYIDIVLMGQCFFGHVLTFHRWSMPFGRWS